MPVVTKLLLCIVPETNYCLLMLHLVIASSALTSRSPCANMVLCCFHHTHFLSTVNSLTPFRGAQKGRHHLWMPTLIIVPPLQTTSTFRAVRAPFPFILFF